VDTITIEVVMVVVAEEATTIKDRAEMVLKRIQRDQRDKQVH
jgi:hypothetical protein